MPNSFADSRPIIITEIEQFGGAERSLLALAHWLHGQGLAHYFLTYIDHCNIAQYARDPLTVVELKPRPGARNKIASLRRHFAERGPSALKPLTSGYQPALHLTLAGERDFHCLMHDTPSLFGDTRSLKRDVRIFVSNIVVGYGLRGKGKTIVASEYLRSECRRNFGVDAEIVRPGGFVGTEPPRLRPSNGKLHMLSVCRIEENKRLDWILRALAELEKPPRPLSSRPLSSRPLSSWPLSSRVDWRIDFAGKGSQIPILKELAASLGIAGRVHFHGFVSDNELEALHGEAHLILMPAIQGYGLPAIESLQRGIPVLLHRESGVSDILLDTPWATVLDGGESNMAGTMMAAIDKVIEGRHHNIPVPPLPTQDEWAEHVARLCGWVE